MSGQEDWRFHILRNTERSNSKGEKDVSESLIVEVRRLRDAQEAIKRRLEEMLEALSQPITGAEDVGELLTLLDDAITKRDE